MIAAFGAPRPDAWTVIGPGGGGAQFFPAINPLNPHDIFIACDMTGAYVSHDGGSTWRIFNTSGSSSVSVQAGARTR